MPAPKGHPPYPGCEKGGPLGRLATAWTDEELDALAQELVDYMKQPKSIWFKNFLIQKGITEDSYRSLRKKNMRFRAMTDVARAIQEEKLVTMPFFKEADGNHARFILEKYVKGDWKDTSQDQVSENLVNQYNSLMSQLSDLQRKMAESNNKSEDNS